MGLRKFTRVAFLIVSFITIIILLALFIYLLEKRNINKYNIISNGYNNISKEEDNGKTKQPIKIFLTAEGSLTKGSSLTLKVKAKPLVFAEKLKVEIFLVTALSKELLVSNFFESISATDSVQISTTALLPSTDKAEILATARIEKPDGNILATSEIMKLDLILGRTFIEKQMKVEDLKAPSILMSVPSDSLPLSQKKSENLEASAGFWVTGKFEYDDSPVTDAGYGAIVRRPIRNARVEIRDLEVIGSELLGTVSTDNSGNFQFFVPNNDDGVLQNGRDIFVDLYAISNGGNVQSNSIGGQYFIESQTINDWAGGDLYLGSLKPADASGNAVYNILENLTLAYECVSGISTPPPSVTVMWSEGNTDGTHYHSSSNQIHLLGTSNDPDQFDDDILLHEYGHFLAAKYSYDKSAGGDHSWYGHYTAELAWSEGWAHFFSSACRNSNLQRDYTVGSVSRLNLETPGTSGSDNEGAVAAILWDIFDSNSDGADNLSLGISRTWSIFDDGSTNRFFNSSKLCVIKDFWDGWFFLNYASGQQIWAIFNQYGVNYDITVPTNPTSVSSTTHTISNWSTSRIVDMAWSGASDDLSGVSGYSWDFTSSSTTVPDQIVDGTGLSATSPSLADGTNWYFHIRTKDNAGNWIASAVHRGPYYIDATSPSGTITISSGVSTTCLNVVPLSISANDNLSGVTQMQFSNDGSTWSAWETYSTYRSWNLLLYGGYSSAGNKVVYARFKDLAGNVSAIVNDNIQYEIVPPPTVNLTQPTCLVSTGTITVSVPTGAGMTYSLDGSTYSNTTGIFTFVTPGSYTVTAKSAAGCISITGTNATINPQPTAPPSPIVIVTQPTCSEPSGTITITSPLGSGMTYSINGSTYTNTTGIFNSVPSGTYTVTARSSAGCKSLGTNITINSQLSTPSTPVAILTQPSCSISTGTITITSPTGSGMTYSINDISYTNTSGVFNSVASGTYSLTARSSDGCISSAAIVTINDQPSTPSAPITSMVQPTCSISTGTITITSPSGPGMTYSINSSTYTNTTGVFNSVAPGIYTVTARNSNGCTSPGTNVTINSQPSTPSAPIVTLTQPTCSVSTGTITITSPTGSGMTYSINGSTYTNTTGVFNSVTPGTYTVTARNSNGCTSPGTNTTINSQPSTPSAPIATLAQPTCSMSTGTITITSPSGSGMTYSINGSTYTNTSGVFNSVPSGNYTLTARSSAGCTSSGTIVTINDQPLTPTAPIVTLIQPTCSISTGTITITSPTGSGMTYSINGSSYTNTTGVFNSVASGTYTITARNSSGCTSPVTNVTINSQPSTPTAPIATLTQPTCSISTGTITITSPTGSGMAYSINGSTYSNTSGIFTSITPGTYTITARNLSGCTSAGTIVTINSQPATPIITNQSTSILSGGTFTVTPGGVPVGTTYTWTTPTYTGGVTGGSAQTNSQSSISGSLTIPSGTGTAIYTVTPTAGSCIGVPFTVTVTVTSSCIPVSVEVQPANNNMCATIGNSSFTVVVNGTAPFTYQWQYYNGSTWMNVSNNTPAGASYTNANQPTMGVSGITSSGSHQYRCSITNCVSSNTTSNTATLSVIAAPLVPILGTITQPSCNIATGSVVLIGLPATGIWTINPGGIAGSGTSTTISGLPAGTYNFSVTNASGCNSATTTNVVINTFSGSPAIPTIGTILQPTCSIATGSVVLNNLPPTGSWTINPGNIFGTGTTKTISGLQAGSYTFTVTNSNGCMSLASDEVIINSQPVTPNVPNQTTSVLTSNTFSTTPNGVPTGTTYTWTTPVYTGGVHGGSAQSTPQLSISGTLTIPSGIGTAIYTVTPIFGSCIGNTFTLTVTVSFSCSSVSIGIQPADKNLCTNSGSASFTVGADGTAPFIYQWQIYNGGLWSQVLNNIPSGALYTDASMPTMSVAGIISSGSYQYRCIISNCTSASAISNKATLTISSTPTAPLIESIVQPTFAMPTGSVVLNGLPSVGTWTINPGSYTGTGTSKTITGLVSGIYTFTVSNVYGCTSSPSVNVIINAPSSILNVSDVNGILLHQNDTLIVPSNAGILSLVIESSAEWKALESALWFKAVQESNTSLKIGYLENISVIDKIASLKVKSLNNEIILNILQKARISALRSSIQKFNNVKMFPNPAVSSIYLDMGNEKFDRVIISVMNIQGNLLKTKEYRNLSVNQILEINVAELPTGQYWIQVGDEIYRKVFQLVKF